MSALVLLAQPAFTTAADTTGDWTAWGFTHGHYYHDDSRHRVHCEADELLHLGDMIIVAETLTYLHGQGRRPERFLMRYTRYGERELWQGDLMGGPYAFDGGYVVCVSGRTLIFGRGDDD